MSNVNEEIGGRDFHCGDCYVWSAIHYLDSPTDYREYLPQQGVLRSVIGDDLVMLDSQSNFPWPRTRFARLSALAMLTFLIGAFLCFLALHL
jgi:hypothetical protein